MMKEGGKKRIAEAERDRDQFVPAKKFQTRRGSFAWDLPPSLPYKQIDHYYFYLMI